MDSPAPVNKMRNYSFIACTAFMWPATCWASGDISAIYLISVDTLVFIFSIYYATKIKCTKNKVYAMASIFLLFLFKSIINFKVPFIDNKFSIITSTCIFVITSVCIIIRFKK